MEQQNELMFLGQGGMTFTAGSIDTPQEVVSPFAITLKHTEDPGCDGACSCAPWHLTAEVAGRATVTKLWLAVATLPPAC
jgi:hypothetical protein